MKARVSLGLASIALVLVGWFAFGRMGPAAPRPVVEAPAPLHAVWTWGSNAHGQLGVVPTNQRTPSATLGLGDATALAAGTFYTLALRPDGTVWAWGDNEVGQLGNGS